MHLSHGNALKPLRRTLLPSEGNCSVFDLNSTATVYGWDSVTVSPWEMALTHDVEPGVAVSNTTGNVIEWSRLLLHYAVNQTFLNQAFYDRGYLRVVVIFDHNPEDGLLPTVDQLFAECAGGNVSSPSSIDCFQNPLYAERFQFLLDDLFYVPSVWRNGSGLYSTYHSTQTVGTVTGDIDPASVGSGYVANLNSDVVTYGVDAAGQSRDPNRSAFVTCETYTRDSSMTREYEIDLHGLRTVMDRTGSYARSGSLWVLAWYQYTEVSPTDPTVEDPAPFELAVRTRLIGESSMRPAGFKKLKLH